VAQRVSAMYQCIVTQGYGLTETSPTTNTNPLRRVKPASVGPPISDTQEKVVHLETGEELPPGEVGELLTVPGDARLPRQLRLPPVHD
jgi:long-chain acyl-CoA synthetase